MKIVFLTVGKTEDAYLKDGIDKYVKRLKHYTRLEVIELAELKNTKALTPEQQKVKEAEMILKKVSPLDHVVLLDENGKNFSSVGFSEELQKKMNSGIKTLVFVIGGPYGFSEAVYGKAQGKISLSAMTFSHQMVRLFFIEQLYRAFTILRNEPYHHQ